MYSKPSSTSELIQLVIPGPDVKILDYSFSYYHKIEYKEKIGYISKAQWTKYLNGTLSKPNNSNTVKSSQPKTRNSGRRYIRGPRGGCYYINSNGNKIYVDRSLCN